jgi:intergrase/recombinase
MHSILTYSFTFSGPGHRHISITLDGNLIAEFTGTTENEVSKAFLVQFGCLYIFDKSFAIRKNEKNKTVLAIRNFFEFVTYDIMKIQTKTERLKRCCKEVTKLRQAMDEV